MVQYSKRTQNALTKLLATLQLIKWHPDSSLAYVRTPRHERDAFPRFWDIRRKLSAKPLKFKTLNLENHLASMLLTRDELRECDTYSTPQHSTMEIVASNSICWAFGIPRHRLMSIEVLIFLRREGYGSTIYRRALPIAARAAIPKLTSQYGQCVYALYNIIIQLYVVALYM